MKYKSLYDPIYKTRVHFFWKGTPEEMNKWLVAQKREPIDLKGTRAVFHVFDDVQAEHAEDESATAYLLYLHKTCGISSLAHETLHLVMRALNDCGIEISYKNDEVLAYYMGYWMEVFTHLLRKI